MFAPAAVVTVYAEPCTSSAQDGSELPTGCDPNEIATSSSTDSPSDSATEDGTPETTSVPPETANECTESNTSLSCTTLEIDYEVDALCPGSMNTDERQAANEDALAAAEKNETPDAGDPSLCGEPHDDGTYEPGDCSPQYDSDGKLDENARGYVITEITEIIGDDTSVDDNRIVTLYKGTCCVTTNKLKGNCVETSYVYAKDYTKCTGTAINCQKIQWIIGSSGAGILKVYVKQLYGWAAGTIGFIVVVTIIINGIRISVSGVSGDITTAKDNILKAISALVLLFLSGLLLYTINPAFFG